MENNYLIKAGFVDIASICAYFFALPDSHLSFPSSCFPLLPPFISSSVPLTFPAFLLLSQLKWQRPRGFDRRTPRRPCSQITLTAGALWGHRHVIQAGAASASWNDTWTKAQLKKRRSCFKHNTSKRRKKCPTGASDQEEEWKSSEFGLSLPGSHTMLRFSQISVKLRGSLVLKLLVSFCRV